MDDLSLVELFFERDECALAILEEKYGKACRMIAENVLSDTRDAEECVNDTLLAVWNSIPPTRPRSLHGFVLRIARAKAIDKLRYNTREKRDCSQLILLEEIDECAAPTEVGDNECEELINGLLSSLGVRSRVIFVSRYFRLESVSSIAKRLGLSENVVSVDLFRTRKKLKKILIQKGIKR